MEDSKGKRYLLETQKSFAFLNIATKARAVLKSKFGYTVGKFEFSVKKDSVKTSLYSKGKHIGYVSVGKDGKILVRNTNGNYPIDINGKIEDVPAALAVHAKKMEASEKAKSKIKEVKVNENGILIVGDNLPAQTKPIKIDPTTAWIDINRGIKSGVQNINIGTKTAKIDKNLTTILKNAVKRAVNSIKDIDTEAVMSKISDDQLKELKKETLDKHRPEIVIWGVASMEGGFTTNKRIAMARATSARGKLEKQNPGVKIRVKWAIQGLGGKITNVQELAANEKDMIKYWDKDVNLKGKVKNIQEIYAKLKKPSSWTQEEGKFFKENFLDARRAMMTVEYPKGIPAPQIAMKFEKSPNAPA